MGQDLWRQAFVIERAHAFSDTAPMHKLSLALASIFTLSAAVAQADVVEPGFVETCTLDRVQAEHAGQTCIACNTSFSAPLQCTEQFSREGYTEACRSRGASVWAQIGCRAGEPTAAPTPTPAPHVEPTPAPTPAAAPPAESSQCTASVGASSSLMAMLVACSAVVLSGRRRKAC